MSSPLQNLRSIPLRIFEVERKFKPSPESIRMLRGNTGTPAFKESERLEPKLFEDTYYDHRSLLASNGVWLRLRNDKWEAKIDHGGDFTNSRFEELVEIDGLNEMLQKYIYQARIGEKGDFWRLEQFAKFTTFREAWRIDKEFEVVLDKVDFGQQVVGEVELVASVEGDDNLETRKDETMAELDRRIEEFMKHYSWAFPGGKLRGKLSAYLRWRKEQEAFMRNGERDLVEKKGY